MAKIKFYDTSLLVENGIKLTTVISLSNKQQTEEGFEVFIDEVIKAHPKAVVELEVILTAELYRHYYGHEGAINTAQDWLNTNQIYLDRLTKHQVPYQIRPWSDLITMPIYPENCLKIEKLYQEDNVFFNIVNDLASKFTKNNTTSHSDAIQFLLEECAVGLGMTGHIIYPHKELNTAISYTLTKFSAQFKYIPYKVIYKRTKSKSPKAEAISSSYPLYQHMVNLDLGQYDKSEQNFQREYNGTFAQDFETSNKLINATIHLKKTRSAESIISHTRE